MTQQLQIPSQDCATQVRELPSDELEKAVGGLLPAVQIAVDPSDPSGSTAVYTKVALSYPVYRGS